MASAQSAPKHEFRGAWLHVIGQSQWMNKTSAAQRAYIDEQLDRLQEAGCNAVIFQVRPTADALYISEIEPWSKWLTGKRGKAPNPVWDPLEYITEAAHRRGMELHAWLNPYRVTSDAKEVLPPDHLYNQHPERFFRFDGKIFFDPAYQENRDYIARVIGDIVTRYDIDAIHLDDYFYPYPSANGPFRHGDDASYEKFGKGQNRGDWRRANVDKLIEQLHGTIKGIKPWVRFGISPFGIWRNKANDPKGSASSGLQNYDDLYADVILWAEKGWIDYLAPQLYWELDTRAAPSRKLAPWWAEHTPKTCQLYIGQDTKRTMDKGELDEKVKIARSLPGVDGEVWWHGYWVTGNYKGALDALASRHQRSLALTPEYGKNGKHPDKVTGLHASQGALQWDHAKNFAGPGAQKDARQAREGDIMKYVVYQFGPGEKEDLNDADAIIAITPQNSLALDSAESGTVFVVTAVDRMGREGAPSARLIVK